MVLVDTSVWIRFLANRAPYAAELLLGLDEVTGHELVYGELLIGTAEAGGSFWPPTSGYTKRVRFLTATSSRSFTIATCMVAAWAGSTFTSSRPLWWGDCNYGRPTRVSRPLLTSLVSLTRCLPRSLGNFLDVSYSA
jgi:hypothetical protein